MGSGYRTFTAGEVLTASNVQNYLQDQAVMVFAGTAARSSAIGTANFEEGMLTYLTDVDKLQVYTGSSFADVYPAAASTGKVVQIVYASTGSEKVSSSSTYVDTNLTATITPTSASNKILVMVTHGSNQKETNNTALSMRLFRGATQIAQMIASGGKNAASDRQEFGSIATNVLDEPATTSATTYKTQFASQANNAQVIVQLDGTLSTMILMEVTP
jgi:hypothetical protein